MPKKIHQVSQLISTQRATVNEHPPTLQLLPNDDPLRRNDNNRGRYSLPLRSANPSGETGKTLVTSYLDSDSQQHLSIVFLDSLQKNLPSLISQQQVFTSLSVSLQTIFEAANPVGAASRAAANNPNIAFFI